VTVSPNATPLPSQRTRRELESDALRAALQLPWPAFPLRHDKTPACSGGFKSACKGTELEALWKRCPGVLPGVPTGEPSGVSVLDIDPGKGGDAYWDAIRDRLPLTRIHETRGGGLHVLFRHRAGLRNSASKLAPGVDIRADGGYVVYWPAAGFSVVDHPIAPWPDLLAPREPERPRYVASTSGPVDNSRYGAAALDRACSAIGGAANGDQEATLNRECFSIGQLAGGGVLDRGDALDRITAAAFSMPNYDPRRPWTANELLSKVRRSFEQGLQRPRNPARGA
jgi:hypothetical protein